MLQQELMKLKEALNFVVFDNKEYPEEKKDDLDSIVNSNIFDDEFKMGLQQQVLPPADDYGGRGDSEEGDSFIQDFYKEINWEDEFKINTDAEFL